MNAVATAKSQGFVLCRDCHLVVKVGALAPGLSSYCPRCGSTLHARTPNSIGRTWALVICAWVAIVPANLFPVMTVIHFGNGEPDTIMSGVIHLVQAHMTPIAVLVFIASIVVPLLKLVALMVLMLTVQFKWRLNRQQCTVLYRIVAFIGAWSMLDLFMISIMVTLVDLGSVATVRAGTGATAFATVVVLTLLAAMSFDPRLLWDLQEDIDHE